MGTAEESAAPLYPVRWSPYGFGWGPNLVQRMIHHTRKDRGRLRENFLIEVATGQVIENERDGAKIDAPRHRVHIYASRTGRNVQVFLDGERLVRESIVTGLLADLEDAEDRVRAARRGA